MRCARYTAEFASMLAHAMTTCSAHHVCPCSPKMTCVLVVSFLLPLFCTRVQWLPLRQFSPILSRSEIIVRFALPSVHFSDRATASRRVPHRCRAPSRSVMRPVFSLLPLKPVLHTSCILPKSSLWDDILLNSRKPLYIKQEPQILTCWIATCFALQM